jgi:hypothetical protein
MVASARKRSRERVFTILILGLCVFAHHAGARDGRLLATGGATQIEGSAGGGIVPWAMLSGYGERGQSGGTAFATRVDSGDYALDAAGVAYAFGNRVEFSLARQRFDLGALQDALGLPMAALWQDIAVVYTPWPQVAVGAQHKRTRDFDLPSAVGARRDSGTDVYIAASKLFLAGAAGRHLLVNVTVRSSSANQIGLLGFGGDRRDERSWLLEASTAVLLNPRWAIGLEYRQKPDNLGFAREDDWRDAFVAWFPNKHVAVVAAVADLGSIATLDGQTAGYLSVQASF